VPRSAPSPAQLKSWGIDPSWSRFVSIDGADGRPVEWHVFDTGPAPEGTIVCVHGNPTWGYLWRDLLTTLSPRFRVIAVDQTGMGFSERGRPRRLEQRVDELVSFCRQEVDGPLILAAHDWGGPITVGAAGQLDPIALILANTAVAKPDDVAVPPLIAAARSLVDLSCRRTPAFIAGTARMTSPDHREALRAPYRSAPRREAIRDFVADIPVVPSDPSAGALYRCAAVLETLHIPTLLLWGGRDPVFHDRFLADLRRRIPHADVERFDDAAHLVLLDKHVGAIVEEWLDARHEHSDAPHEAAGAFSTIVSMVDERSDDVRPLYLGPDGSLTWADLAHRSNQAVSLLMKAGLGHGDKVAVLIPPSPELLIAAVAIWRAGAVPVVADASGGVGMLRRLLRAQGPRFVIGIPASLIAARALRITPGAQAACFGSFPGAINLTVQSTEASVTPALLQPDDLAAIVHTSGSTGPAKAVRYTHGALAAQREALRSTLVLAEDDAFTTSFGPFMLLAPSLGITSVRPDFPVDDPASLGFDQLATALTRASVTTAWLSPVSARHIVSTARDRTLSLATTLLAGAPIPRPLAEAVGAITGGEVRAPYGMTECLPVTDGREPLALGSMGGGCTGRPVHGCEVVIEPLHDDEQWGEILIRAPWMFDGYDGRWHVDASTWVEVDKKPFHRTGDVGYLDEGRLFQLGRLQHVIRTERGPIASVAVEEPIAEVLGKAASAVGIGPSGRQVVCIVIEGEGKLRLVSAPLARSVRAAAPCTVAAVLEGPFPLDRRHHSKVDRIALASMASQFLAGR